MRQNALPSNRHRSRRGVNELTSLGRTEPVVTGYVDQHEHRWLQVEYKGRQGFIPLDEFTTSSAGMKKRLAAQGVVVMMRSTENSIARQAEAASYDRQLFAADQSGWVGGKYFWPNDPLSSSFEGVPIVDNRPSTSTRYETAGTMLEWQQAVLPLADGRPVVAFAVCCAFASLLLEFVPLEDNPGFELSGPSSIGKSKLALLVASVFGRGPDLRRTWDTTVNALEPSMAKCADSVMFLDETGMFLTAWDAARARDYRGAIMKLAAGTSKERLGAIAQPDRRFIFLSTTNVPVAELVSNFTPAEVLATTVRLSTIPADAGAGFGIFERVPAGFSDGASAIDRMQTIAQTQHGWAARAFVTCLEQRLATPIGRARLARMIQRELHLFKRVALAENSGGTDSRVIDKFGLVAAAGALASHWRVLLLDDLPAQVLTAYRRHASVPVPQRHMSAPEAVQAYVSCHRAALHDITEGTFPELCDAELDAAPGFIKRRDGAVWLLIRSSRWKSEFGVRAKPMLDELRASKQLWARDGLQSQDKVRASRTKDRVYRIKLNGA